MELDNGVEARKVLKCVLEKAEIAMKGVLKGNSDENSERKEESWRKSPPSS